MSVATKGATLSSRGTRVARQPDELLDEKCPLCESQLVKKHGQYGEFIGCTAYPKCKFIRSKTLGIKCPKCEVGELTERVALATAPGYEWTTTPQDELAVRFWQRMSRTTGASLTDDPDRAGPCPHMR